MTSTDIFAETAVTSAHFILQDQSVTAALDYTLSFLAKAGGASIVQIAPSTGFSSNYVTFDLSAGTKTQVGSGTSVMTDKGNGWYLCAFTVPATSTTAGGRFAIGLVPLESSSRLFSYLGAVTNTILLKDPQFEQKSSHTRFVDGTRSTTQAIVDLTGNSTITANNLTYTSDDFSLNGTTSEIVTGVITGLGVATESHTFSVWCSPNTAAGDIVNMVTGTGWDMCPIWSAGSLFYGKVWENTSLVSLATFTTGLYYNVVVTYDHSSTTSALYVNGVLQGSTVGAYSSSGLDNFLQIGQAGAQATNTFFNGSIDSAQVYRNKALTLAEVNQNFEVQRVRYGI
jgi:hypothetical protein